MTHQFTLKVKKLFLVVFLSLGSFGLKLQAQDWKPIETESSVEFYYQITECQENQVLIIRAVNPDNKEVTFSWNATVKFPGFEDSTQKRTYNLKAKENAIGNCEDPQLQKLSYFLNIPYEGQEIAFQIEIID